MMKTLLTTASLVAMLTAPAAWAETNLKLVEVITSPARTEMLQKMLTAYKAQHPDVEIEVVSLPFYKLSTKFGDLDQSKTYLLWCERGVMSRLQALYLREQGFANVKVYRP